MIVKQENAFFGLSPALPTLFILLVHSQEVETLIKIACEPLNIAVGRDFSIFAFRPWRSEAQQDW
jgi:hypothetical protein